MRISEILGGSLSAPRISSDGAPIAPDRTKREKCWESRDIFFKCLDQYEITDSIQEKAKVDQVCGCEEKKFQTHCAASWVTYFKQKRVAEQKKAEVLEKLKAEGAVRLEGELPPLPIRK